MSHGDNTVAINVHEDDHGHGHSHGGHDHGHGHSHGGNDHDHSKCGGHAHGQTHSQRKKDLQLKWLGGHGFEIKAFIYFIIINAWVFTLFLTTKPLEGYAFDKTASDIFMSFLVLMACISYYKCFTVKNSNPSKAVPAHAGPQERHQCKTCSFWKPERTHHCRACNECVLRMDHHCPWIVNCVGYRNHKSFVLMVTYIGIGGLYSSYRSVMHLIYTLDDETFYDMNLLLMIYWILLTIAITFISIMVLGLAAYHIVLAMNNLTTLESMGGTNMKLPWESQESIDKKFTNQFDRGMLANLYEFFGNTYFWFWYPTVPKTFYTGMNWEKIGNPNPTEVLDYLRGKNGTTGESPEERIMKPRNLSEVDLANIFKLAEEYTKDKHMQFFDKMLEVGKRKDHTYRAPQPQPQPQPEPQVINIHEQHDQQHQQQSEENHQEQHQQEVKENLLEKSPTKDSKSESSNVEVVKSETEEQDKEDVTVVSESTSNDPKAE